MDESKSTSPFHGAVCEHPFAPRPAPGESLHALGIECRPTTPNEATVVREWVGESGDGARVIICEISSDEVFQWRIEVSGLDTSVTPAWWAPLFYAVSEAFEEAHQRARAKLASLSTSVRALEVAMTECTPPLLDSVRLDAFGVGVLVQRSTVDAVPMIDIDVDDAEDDDEPHLRIFVNDEVLHEHPTIEEVTAERAERGACELCGAEPGEQHRADCPEASSATSGEG